MNPTPRPQHQIVLSNLFLALRELKSSGRAELLTSPLDVHLSETDIVQPDLIAVASKSAHLIGELKIEGPPELVVEILDPGENTLCQQTLAEGRYSETLLASGEVVSTAFPGFAFDLASVF